MAATSRYQTDGLLTELADRIGLAGLALDSEGSAQLAFDDVFVSLQLDEDAGYLVLTSPIGEPAGDKAEAYGRLLDANHYWSATGGGTLSRQRDSGVVFLQRGLPVSGLDGAAFETELQRFVDAAEALSGSLDTVGTAEDEQEGSDAAPTTMIMG